MQAEELCDDGPFKDMLERLVLRMLALGMQTVVGPHKSPANADYLFKIGITQNLLHRVGTRGVPYDAFEVRKQKTGRDDKPYWEESDPLGRGLSTFIAKSMAQLEDGSLRGATCVGVAVPIAFYHALKSTSERSQLLASRSM